jgi:tetratricopeptide (TPR) repeat protein
MGYDVRGEYLNMIRGKIQEGNFKGAIKDADKLIGYDANLAIAWYYRSVCHFSENNFQASLSDCARSLELDPNQPKAMFNLGLSKYYLGQKTEAIEDMKKARDMFLGEIEIEAAQKCTEAIDMLSKEG